MKPAEPSTQCKANPVLAGAVGTAAGFSAPEASLIKPVSKFLKAFFDSDFAEAALEGTEIGGEAGGPIGAFGGLVAGGIVGATSYYVDQKTSGDIFKPINSLGTGCTP